MTSPDGRLPTQAGMLQILWTSKAWRLLAILLVHISGLMLMVPLLPGLVTDDFASRRAGERLKCDDIAPSLAPAACINAHADAVWWSTITSFFQSTIFSLLLASFHSSCGLLLLLRNFAVRSRMKNKREYRMTLPLADSCCRCMERRPWP